MGTDEVDRGYRAMFQEVSNWGRWGKDDQAGTLNLIGPAERLRALATVTDGEMVSCARDVVRTASQRMLNPAQWSIIHGGDVIPAQGAGATTDRMTIAPHGAEHTHLDALCHVAFDGVLYNGRPASAVTSSGIEVNDLSAMLDGVVSRGVLLDLPALRGVDYIDPGEPIVPEELEAAERASGVSVLPGDIVAVRVGRDERIVAEGPDCERVDGRWTLAGMRGECLRWMRDRDVGILMCDAVSDYTPRDSSFGPLHVGALVYLGMPLVDNACLTRLTDHCREAGRAEFALSLTPLRWFGTTGAAINPIALF